MASTWIDDGVVDASDPLGDDYGDAEYGDDLGEGYDDAYDDAESKRSREAQARRLQAQKRAVVVAQRQRAARARSARGGAPQSPRAAAVAVQEKVRDLGVTAQARDDLLEKAVAAQRKRNDRTDLAFVASRVGDQVKTEYPDLFKNKFVATGVAVAPILALQRGGGGGGVLGDRRVQAVAAIGALRLVGALTQKSQDVDDMRITRSESTLHTGDTSLFRADALDAKGNVIADQRKNIVWAVSPEGVATVDKNGRVTASTAGRVKISATLGDLIDEVRVTVSAAPQLP